MITESNTNTDEETGLTIIYKTKALTNPQRHFHGSWELFYIISGERTFFHGNATYNIHSGDLICVPPRVLHRALNRQNEVCELITLYFQNTESSFFKNVLPLLEKMATSHNQIISIRSSDQKRVERNLLEIGKELQRKDDGYIQMSWGLLYQTLVEIHRFVVPYEYHEKKQFSPQIEKAIQYITENLSSNLSLLSVSSISGFSQSYFSRLFHKETHFSFTDYISHLRIQKASSLLISTTFTISVIADMCGFGCVTQFGRVFKTLMGEKPMSYRKRMKREMIS